MAEGNSVIVHKKLGFRVSPPALVLQYSQRDHTILDVCRRRQRTMPLRNLTSTCSLVPFIDDLIERQKPFLEKIPTVKIERLLRILQELMKGSTLSESVGTVENEFRIDPEEDLNKVNDDTLRIKKALMDDEFEANRIKPGDEGFFYDIEKEFEPIDPSAWDSGNEDYEF